MAFDFGDGSCAAFCCGNFQLEGSIIPSAPVVTNRKDTEGSSYPAGSSITQADLSSSHSSRSPVLASNEHTTMDNFFDSYETSKRLPLNALVIAHGVLVNIDSFAKSLRESISHRVGLGLFSPSSRLFKGASPIPDSNIDDYRTTSLERLLISFETGSKTGRLRPTLKKKLSHHYRESKENSMQIAAHHPADMPEDNSVIRKLLDVRVVINPAKKSKHAQLRRQRKEKKMVCQRHLLALTIYIQEIMTHLINTMPLTMPHFRNSLCICINV